MDVAFLVDVSARQAKRILSLESHRPSSSEQPKTTRPARVPRAGRIVAAVTDVDVDSGVVLVDLELHLLDVQLDVEALDLLASSPRASSSENFLKPTFSSSISPSSSFMSGPRNTMRPSSRRPRGGDRRRTTSSRALRPRVVVGVRDRELEVGDRHLRRVLGRLAEDTDLVGRDRALPGERVDRRDARCTAGHRSRRGSSSTATPSASGRSCRGCPRRRPWPSERCSASNSTSKYAASLLEPSSLGTVTPVISAFMKSSCDCAL